MAKSSAVDVHEAHRADVGHPVVHLDRSGRRALVRLDALLLPPLRVVHIPVRAKGLLHRRARAIQPDADRLRPDGQRLLRANHRLDRGQYLAQVRARLLHDAIRRPPRRRLAKVRVHAALDLTRRLRSVAAQQCGGQRGRRALDQARRELERHDRWTVVNPNRPEGPPIRAHAAAQPVVRHGPIPVLPVERAFDDHLLALVEPVGEFLQFPRLHAADRFVGYPEEALLAIRERRARSHACVDLRSQQRHSCVHPPGLPGSRRAPLLLAVAPSLRLLHRLGHRCLDRF